MPKICKMMRGFQIWPEYSNQIRFEPFFGKKKLSGIGKLPDLANFDRFFLPKKGSNLI